MGGERGETGGSATELKPQAATELSALTRKMMGV